MQSSERRSHLLGHERRAASRHASPSLLQSFVTQLRVIYALIMREIHTRYGRENIGFYGLLASLYCFVQVLQSYGRQCDHLMRMG